MPTKSITLRIDVELLNYLTTRAQQENRTLSNMIVTILRNERERTTGGDD